MLLDEGLDGANMLLDEHDGSKSLYLNSVDSNQLDSWHFIGFINQVEREYQRREKLTK